MTLIDKSNGRRKYTVSKKVIEANRVRRLDHGASCKIITALSNCFNCPVRDICDNFKVWSTDKKKEGCKDVRAVYVNNLRLFNRPEVMIVQALAEIQTNLEYQKLLDGKDKVMTSKEWLNLLRIKKDYLELGLKYGRGTKQQITVEHKKVPSDEEIIIVETKPEVSA